jgi:hypothetical protein
MALFLAWYGGKICDVTTGVITLVWHQDGHPTTPTEVPGEQRSDLHVHGRNQQRKFEALLTSLRLDRFRKEE